MDGYEVKLREIADIQVGYQARGRVEENLDGNFTIIRSQNFDDAGNLMLDEAMRFSPPRNIDPQKYLITIGDILVQARGRSHLAYMIEEPLENTVSGNTFYIIRIKEQARIFPAYLAWWINQPKMQAYFEQERGISTIPFISKSALQDCVVQIPAMETQEKIVNMVNLWQREQQLTHQLIEKKDALVQALCRTAATSGKE